MSESNLDLLAEAVGKLSVASTKTGLAYDERMCGHEDPDGDHPECPERITGIYQELVAQGLAQRCERIPVREATFDELTTVHSKRHCAQVLDMKSMSLRDLMYG